MHCNLEEADSIQVRISDRAPLDDGKGVDREVSLEDYHWNPSTY
jgi:hypothetical protein